MRKEGRKCRTNIDSATLWKEKNCITLILHGVQLEKLLKANYFLPNNDNPKICLKQWSIYMYHLLKPVLH